MRKHFSLIITVVFFCSFTYSSTYTMQYNDAVVFLKTNDATIANTCTKLSTDKALMEAMVFPEITRYNLLKDYFESSGNEFLYVKGGKTWCDFSIGNFQMKPSFAEDVEAIVLATPHLSRFSEMTKYSSTDEKKIRTERVARLKSVEWQSKYACAFIAITKAKMPADMHGDKEKELQFLAAAYNLGCKATASDIQKWQGIKSFPYGRPSSKFSYAEVALEYYQTQKNN
jgi:hypothetical protein